jgi:hypothetical protein
MKSVLGALGVLAVSVCGLACGSSRNARATPSTESNSAPALDDASPVDAAPVDEMSPAIPTGQEPPSMYIPSISGTCPPMQTGSVIFSGQKWQLWAGMPTADQHGPVLIYWHGTGSTSSEPIATIGQAQIDAITGEGGIVASAQSTMSQGMNTGNNVWYTGDFDMADQILACSIEQLHIDKKRIYVSGASAGGLQAVAMSYGRSGYLAAAAPLSGGLLFSTPQQDASHVPSAMATHGAQGKDVVTVDFAQLSAKWEADVMAKGGFAIDCNTGGGHVSGPPAIGPAIWQFLQDHPFNVTPEPYMGMLPSVFPSYCQIQ